MIRIAPYYERGNGDEIQREYLRMIAASTPFLAEDVLYDDPMGLSSCRRTPKTRHRGGAPTPFSRLLQARGILDGVDREERLLAEAQLAELIVHDYSDALHELLYGGHEGTGHVNRENLRRLLLLRLQNGQIPHGYRFHTMRSGPQGEWDRRAKALYDLVFCYDNFSTLKPSRRHGAHIGIHELVSLLGVKVCPYCNRQFTTTVSADGHWVRPQLDHFRGKRQYPFLALSVNNLVPACGVCNLLKLDKDCDLAYPYDEGFGEDYAFKTSIPADHTVPALEGIPVSEQDFEIRIERNLSDDQDDERRKRVDGSIEHLCLEELYQSHRDYVAFLYRQRYILTRQLAQDLHDQFPDLFRTAEEVEHVFALMHTDYGRWGDRPLAKLTHDILDEIEELYAGQSPSLCP